MKLNSPFIQLPYRFDVQRLTHELDLLSRAPWRLHPDKTNGNSALPLISRHGGDNDDAIGDMRPTPFLENSPYLKQVVASFDEVFGRSRLMKLEPGCEVSLHVDVHYHWFNRVRIHIPIVTNPDVIFYCGDARVHVPAGECWIFDTWRPHRVVNGGQYSRTHLVIDTAGSSRFWEMVAHADSAGRANQRAEQHFVPFVENLAVQVRTERYSRQPVMSAGEVDYLTNDLIVGFESHSGNDAALVVHYRRCLIGFCNDWRALWYQHGIQESGWPHYQQLLNATRNALPDAEPPILMSDNSTLAKIVFTERLANAALVPEVMEQFVRGVETRPADAASFVASAATASTANRIVTAAGVAGGTDIGRNTRCPCGSGLRYKHCHGAHSMPA